MNSPIETRSACLLPEPVWQARSLDHQSRVDALIDAHPPRRIDTSGNQVNHPVWGFLFTYYSFRPAQLRRWHPGFGVALTGPAAWRYGQFTGYVDSGDTVSVSPAHLAKRRKTLDFVIDLLSGTHGRTARFNCFGLHEWAMVYQAGPEQIRHAGLPLRLSHSATDQVVRSLPLRCTHFDAYRFFTDSARPLNLTALDRKAQVGDEQPGCIHAGMDLYKWSYKLSPLVSSDLVADAFELALRFRELDMRASPYDLSEFGLDPIAVEDAAGRADYVRSQSKLSEDSQRLRARLIETCNTLSAATIR